MRTVMTVTAVCALSISIISASIAQQQGEPINSSSTDTAPVITAEQAGFSSGKVARSVITSDIVNREPVDDLASIDNETATIRFFTDLRNMSGHQVIHRWRYNGEIISEVSFDVKGPRWRVWSSKNMLPHWLGAWEVDVINTMGETIATKQFEYINRHQTDAAAM